MKKFINVFYINEKKEMRINVNNIVYYELADGYDDMSYIHFVDGSEIRVMATPEEIDSKIDGGKHNG